MPKAAAAPTFNVNRTIGVIVPCWTVAAGDGVARDLVRKGGSLGRMAAAVGNDAGNNGSRWIDRLALELAVRG